MNKNLINFADVSENKMFAPAAALAILFLVAAGGAYYYYLKFNELKANPQKIAESEVAETVKRVGEIMVLPEGEAPTVATVADPARLKDQPFFAKAKIGDKVLIYTNARKAILYDPSANKIVEVAPLNIGQ